MTSEDLRVAGSEGIRLGVEERVPPPDRMIAGRASSPRWRALAAVVILSGACFFSNYLLSGGFGLYEDDYSYTLPGLVWTPSDLACALRHAFTTAPEGRPLGHALNALLAYATGRFASLQPAYLAGWLILSLNAVLIYGLFRPLLGGFPSLMAGLIYVTYPVDASKVILMHRAFLHLGMMELLIAFRLFQRGWLVWSYAAAACTLVTYESFFLPFIVAPLLCPDAGRRRASALLRHVAAFAAIAAAVVTIRYLSGESRAEMLVTNLPENATRIATAPMIGARTALWSLVARPADVLLSMSPWVWTTTAFAVILCGLILDRMDTSDDAPSKPAPRWLLAVVGLAALAAPYVLSFRVNYYPPIMNMGRLSGVHAPGALGAALVVAALLSAAMAFGPVTRRGVRLVCALWLGLLVTSGIQIQFSEYMASWKLQSDLWRSVVQQSLDATDGTVVVLDQSVLTSRTAGLLTVQSVLGDPWVLPLWFASPRTWQHPPLLTCNINGYSGAIEATGGGIRTKCPWWWMQWREVRDGEFIVFRQVGGVYERVSEPVTFGGLTLNPKPLGPPNPQLQTSDLYRRLFERMPADGWFRFGHACWYTDVCER